MSLISETMVNVAREAGTYVRCASSRKSADKILRKSRDIIVNALKQVDPTISIWGEGRPSNGHVAVVCPLDTVVNYSRGFGMYGNMIAYLEGGVPKVGIVYLPLSDQVFVTESGSPTRMNGVKAVISAKTNLVAALVACNLNNYVPEDYPLGMDMMQLMMENAFAWRNFGSPALEYAMLALGQIDAVVVPFADATHASGYLVMAQAGAKVTDLRGEPYSFESSSIVAANPALHAELIELFARAHLRG